MKFGNIHFLWVLWIIPVLIFFYIWGHKRKMLLIERFVSKELKGRLLEGVSFTRQKIKALMIILAVCFLVLSLIRPKWGFHWEEVKQKGVDIILALDVSKSMLAEDVSPNRLKRAKREIIDLLGIVEGDRVGLVAFAGTSFLQAPLTLDYGAIRIFLDDLDTDLIPVPGTAIGEAILKSIKSFDEKDKQSRVLIIITDGEDHEGDPLKAAEEAKKAGVKIFTIGIGKEGGAPIPDPEAGGFKKNRNGELILTHIDEEMLQKIALKTGGSYIRSTTGELDLEKIYTNIKKEVEEKELKSGKRKRYEERFQWPLVIAIFLLIFEVLFSERKRRKNGILTLFLFSLLFIPLKSYAFWGQSKAEKAESAYHDGKYEDALKDYTDVQIERPLDREVKYNLANTYFKREQYDEAEKLYTDVATNGEMPLKEQAFYNLGNTAYHQGKLKEAVEFYKEALALNPNDKDAEHNMKFVQDEIKRRIEEMKKQQQNQQQQQQQQQQNKSCDNPNQQQQQDQKDQQKQEGDQKQKEGQDQQKMAQNENGQDKDKKDEEEKKKEKGDQSQEEKKDEEKEQKLAKAGEEKEKDKNEEKKEGQMAQARGQKGQDDDKNKMTPQEAARWFSTLDEDRKKFLRKQMQARGKYRVEKDW